MRSSLRLLLPPLSLFVVCLVFAGAGECADYTAYKATGITIDGHLNESAWSKATWSPLFVDLVTGKTGRLESCAAILWNERFLYIAFRLQEPDVRAALTEQDSPIYRDNDVEVFIDGVDCYYELEINALGTIYEVFWIWDDALNSSRFQKPAFDSTAHPVLKLDGIGQHKHPRGMRSGFLDWDMPDLRWGVAVQGTINKSIDRDKGWTVEIAIPWQSLAVLAGPRQIPPRNGDIWAIDCSRFEHFGEQGDRLDPPAGWAWKQHGAYDSHMPEKFPNIQFSTALLSVLAAKP